LVIESGAIPGEEPARVSQAKGSRNQASATGRKQTLSRLRGWPPPKLILTGCFRPKADA
jgi:hypothetical protein